MSRIIFLFTILVIFAYFQYIYINKVNNKLEITQYENPKKDIFENMMNDKIISIFIKIPINNPKNLILDKENYEKFKNNIDKLIKTNFSYYEIPMCVKSNYNLLFEPNQFKYILKKQTDYRRLIYIVKGTKKFIIFNKNNEKYLYLKNNVSQVNFWNNDLVKYPLFSKSKYIEVILKENMMISLPFQCIFTSINDTDVTLIDMSSESFFSNILRKK